MQTIAPSVNRQWNNVLVIVAANAEYGDPAQMSLMDYTFNGDGPTTDDDSWGITALNGGGATWEAGWPTKFYDDGTYE